MKLVIPKSVTVGKTKYTVLRETPKKFLGYVDYYLGWMYITPQRLPNAELSETFWHEVTHAILYDMQRDDLNNESFVKAFSKRLNQVFTKLPQ